jgi:hypothetical protein
MASQKKEVVSAARELEPEFLGRWFYISTEAVERDIAVPVFQLHCRSGRAA